MRVTSSVPCWKIAASAFRTRTHDSLQALCTLNSSVYLIPQIHYCSQQTKPSDSPCRPGFSAVQALPVTSLSSAVGGTPLLPGQHRALLYKPSLFPRSTTIQGFPHSSTQSTPALVFATNPSVIINITTFIPHNFISIGQHSICTQHSSHDTKLHNQNEYKQPLYRRPLGRR